MTTSPSERPAGGVDPKLLEILVCPVTKGPLEYDADKQELISRTAKLDALAGIEGHAQAVLGGVEPQLGGPALGLGVHERSASGSSRASSGSMIGMPARMG